jgi:hypothetical protein
MAVRALTGGKRRGDAESGRKGDTVTAERREMARKEKWADA